MIYSTLTDQDHAALEFFLTSQFRERFFIYSINKTLNCDFLCCVKQSGYILFNMHFCLQAETILPILLWFAI